MEQNRALYKQPNRIERVFGQLRIIRAIATRYDQLANSFLAMVRPATAGH
ncbi:MAG: transposase [Pseudomonadota bacterium]